MTRLEAVWLSHCWAVTLSIPLQRQTWVFRSKELMLKSGSAVPEGSLVYVREGSSAFLRTPTGWSRLLVPRTEDIPWGPSRWRGSSCSPGKGHQSGFGARAAEPGEGANS